MHESDLYNIFLFYVVCIFLKHHVDSLNFFNGILLIHCKDSARIDFKFLKALLDNITFAR